MMGNIDWFKNSIIYHILIDRFAGFKSNENWEKPIFLGGNLKGIKEKIPYLKKLGINTIWISPFYKTSTYHGYHITDFNKIDPHFGTLGDLKDLIKTVKRDDIKLIADFVPNHCSIKHPFFIDAQKDRNSEYKKWFYFTKWPNKYLCFLRFYELPKINLNYKPAREHIIEAAKYWLKQGLNGFRLDHVIGPSHRFWKQFNKEIKNDFPDIVLIGEAWMQGIKFHELKTINIKRRYLKWMFRESSDLLLKEYKNELDGVLDFNFQKIMREIIARKNSITKSIVYNKMNQHYSRFPSDYYLPSFLDNHDTDRFLYECKNDKEKLKRAAKIQFSIRQPPIIYYGTEIGLRQQKSIWDLKSHGDLQARQPMQWIDQDQDILSFYRKIISERKKI